MDKDDTIKAYSIELDRDLINNLICSVATGIVSEINKLDINDLLEKEVIEIKETLAEIINCVFVGNISFPDEDAEVGMNDMVKLLSNELSNTVLELPDGFPFPVRFLISETIYVDRKLKMSCIMLDINDKDLKDMLLVKKEYKFNIKDQSLNLKKMTKKIK